MSSGLNVTKEGLHTIGQAFPALTPSQVPSSEDLSRHLHKDVLDAIRDYVASDHTNLLAAQALVHATRGSRSGETATSQGSTDPEGREKADFASHDRYFQVLRVRGPAALTFIQSLSIAAVRFETEIHLAYGTNMPDCFAAIRGGLSALLGRVAGVASKQVVFVARAPEVAAPVDARRRWILGHQVFVALTQGLIYTFQIFADGMQRESDAMARDGMNLAADLFLASAASFRFAGSFSPVAYRDQIRPSMAPEFVGDGFSGLLSADHSHLVQIMRSLRPRLAQAKIGLTAEHERMSRSLMQAYDDHKFVCSRFVDEDQPSLRMVSRHPASGIEQLDRFKRARLRLVQGPPSETATNR